MQTVSERWKNAHRRTILNESMVEVSIDIADPEALAAASPKDNGAIYISDTSKLTNGVEINPVPYCTLEQNLWLLDGGRKAIPESEVEDDGYVGDALSNDECVFNGKMPTITINFPKIFVNLIPGITITWSETYGEFADNFIVQAYKDGVLQSEREVIENRSVKSLVFMDIADYNEIVISIKKWCLPNHRARIEEIFIGINKVYGKTELFGYTHKQSVSPVSTSLPKSEINFSIDNVEGEYNPYNDQGLAKYLMERQEIKTRYGLKFEDGSIEWIKGGTFYLSEWYAKQNGISADFTARDLLEFMSDTYRDNVQEIRERKLFELAIAVLERAGLPLNSDGSQKWYIDSSLDDEDFVTTAPLPEDTLANCLQLIANAAGCVLYQDRSGTLHIEPLTMTNEEYKIDSFNSYTKPEITLSKPIKQVRVKVYTYTKGDKGFESTTEEVVHDISNVGETITIDNPLITDEVRAESVASWFASNLRERKELDVSWRTDVRLDALDIVTNENAYNTSAVRMTEVEFKYNGAFRGTGKGKVM